MRQVRHVLIGMASWIAIAALWTLLAIEHKATGPAFRDTALQLAAIAGALLVVTSWWIRHNVAIYRRKGPRQSRVSHPPRTDRDRLGRRVEWRLPAGVESARAERHFVVDVRGDTKTYRVAS